MQSVQKLSIIEIQHKVLYFYSEKKKRLRLFFGNSNGQYKIVNRLYHIFRLIV